MNNPITGIVHVTGEPDTGKTTFALTSGAHPSKIAFFDADVKGRATVAELKAGGIDFPHYFDLVALGAGKREVELHEMCLGLIDGLKGQGLEVVVWDGWTTFENTFKPYVTKHPTQFREFYSPMGQIKGAEQWQASFEYEAVVLGRLLEVAPLVIITTHLKDHRIDLSETKSVKTGKQIPSCKKPLVEKARFRLWLRHNPSGSGQPIGLVLKRLARHSVTAGGIEAVSVLPRRIAPCTWGKILQYWQEPIGNRAPTDDERPDEFELSILDGTLTADQKQVLKLSTLAVEEEARELTSLPKESVIDWALADGLREAGKSPAEIAGALGVSVPDYVKQSGARNGNDAG